MKKITFLLLLLFTSLAGFSTIWTITNSGNSFTPASITINLGDSVNFVLGTSHNASEVSQTTWNANGNIPLSGGFETAFGGGIVLPAQLGVGTHYYVCTPHASVGMKGVIIVQECVVPNTPSTIFGDPTVCASSSNTYSVTQDASATSYTWTLPGGWSGSSISNSIVATSGIVGGIIAVTANNGCGSSAIQSMSLSVISVDTSVFQSGAMLTATLSGASYQWVDCGNNQAISGQTNQSFIANATGNYAVVVTQNNCSDTSSCHNITILEVDESVSGGNITISPNPSGGKFWMSLAGYWFSEKYDVEIYSMTGEKKYQAVKTNSKFEIDLSSWTKGAYCVMISDGRTIVVKRIVIQ